MEKMTKRELCEELIALVEAGKLDAKFADYAEKEIATMDKRAAADKKRKAEKRDADALKAEVLAVLSADKDMTIAEILEAVEDEDATAGKVVSRLTALAKDGTVIKTDVKVDSRTVKGYRLCVIA